MWLLPWPTGGDQAVENTAPPSRRAAHGAPRGRATPTQETRSSGARAGHHSSCVVSYLSENNPPAAAGKHGQATHGLSSPDSPVSTSNDASGPSASSIRLRASASLA